MGRLGILMRGYAEQAPVEADIKGFWIGVGHGEGKLISVVHLAQIHGRGGGKCSPGGIIRSENRIKIGEGTVGIGYHPFHFVAHVIGGMWESRHGRRSLESSQMWQKRKR